MLMLKGGEVNAEAETFCFLEGKSIPFGGLNLMDERITAK